MKYFEEHFLKQVVEYIEGTYKMHYSADAKTDWDDIQLIDVWGARGTLESTSIDLAEKYLFRYGKKDGFNRKDLHKAIHYIIIAMYARDKREGKLPNEARIKRQVQNEVNKRTTSRLPAKRSGPARMESIKGLRRSVRAKRGFKVS